jgi:hypothetical protein
LALWLLRSLCETFNAVNGLPKGALSSLHSDKYYIFFKSYRSFLLSISLAHD